jgi:hypothetical protein
MMAACLFAVRVFVDLLRSHAALAAENAWLRQQLIARGARPPVVFGSTPWRPLNMALACGVVLAPQCAGE